MKQTVVNDGAGGAMAWCSNVPYRLYEDNVCWCYWFRNEVLPF